MRALVIIDMQMDFEGTASKVESAVLSLIRKAKRNREAIFVMRFRGCGRTLPSILDAVQGYDLAFHVTKYARNGSVALTRSMGRAWKRGLVGRFDRVQFCGVYTSRCVRDTFLSACRVAARGVNPAIHPGTEMKVNGRACRDCWGYQNRTNSSALAEIRRQQKLDRPPKALYSQPLWENAGN